MDDNKVDPVPPAYTENPPVQGQPQPLGSNFTAQNSFVNASVTIVHAPSFGPMPIVTTCPYCKNQITTQVHFETGMFTWLLAGGICILGCWMGCCLIPFCIQGCKDVIHHCPNCRTVLGRYSRL